MDQGPSRTLLMFDSTQLFCVFSTYSSSTNQTVISRIDQNTGDYLDSVFLPGDYSPLQAKLLTDTSFIIAGNQNDTLVFTILNRSRQVLETKHTGLFLSTHDIDAVVTDSLGITAIMQSKDQFDYYSTYLVSFNSNLDIVWKKRISEDNKSFGEICTTSTGGYFVTAKIALHYYSSSGDTIWTRKYPHLLPNEGAAILDILPLDSTYLISYTSNQNSVYNFLDGNRCSFFEINESGDDMQNPNLPEYDSLRFLPRRLTKISNGNVIISLVNEHCDHPVHPFFCESEMAFLFLDQELKTKWIFHEYFSTQTRYGDPVTNSYDGGIVCTWSHGINTPRLRLAKFDTLGNTGINGLNHPAETEILEFYPNPARSRLHISNPESFESIEIRDLRGTSMQLVKSQSKLNIEKLSPGAYLISGTTRDGAASSAQKLIIH